MSLHDDPATRDEELRLTKQTYDQYHALQKIRELQRLAFARGCVAGAMLCAAITITLLLILEMLNP